MTSTRARTALVAIVVAAVVTVAAVVASAVPWLTTAIGLAALGALAVGLHQCASVPIGASVGLLAVALATAQPGRGPFAPLEAAALVAVLLTGWWSVDDRWPVAVATGADRARLITTLGLVVGAGLVGVVLLAARNLATVGVAGPVAGAAVAVSLALAAWAAIALDRQRSD